jgi:hypothetical protein
VNRLTTLLLGSLTYVSSCVRRVRRTHKIEDLLPVIEGAVRSFAILLVFEMVLDDLFDCLDEEMGLVVGVVRQILEKLFLVI